MDKGAQVLTSPAVGLPSRFVNFLGFEMRRRLHGSRFVRGASALFAGTVLAQATSLVVWPLLTRFCDPEQFGVLGTYLGLITVLVTVASLRYEYAIPIARHRTHFSGAGTAVAERDYPDRRVGTRRRHFFVLRLHRVRRGGGGQGLLGLPGGGCRGGDSGHSADDPIDRVGGGGMTRIIGEPTGESMRIRLNSPAQWKMVALGFGSTR
jgi:hypothetical protein